MKSLRNKGGSRRGGGERNPFTFFVAGAVVVLIVVFLIGLQVGRVIEKGSARIEGKAAEARPGAAVTAGAPAQAASDVKKDLGAFSEEANRVPAVPPPPASARDEMRATEKSLTFRETLAGKNPGHVPLEKAAPGDNTRAASARAGKGSADRRYRVQAGAFRKKDAADALRKKLEKAGYTATVMRRGPLEKGELHRVLVGPYADADSARSAAKKIKANLKINAILAPG